MWRLNLLKMASVKRALKKGCILVTIKSYSYRIISRHMTLIGLRPVRTCKPKVITCPLRDRMSILIFGALNHAAFYIISWV